LSKSIKIPGVSVSKINFSALVAAAISPATKSALILCFIPSIVEPILEITGIKPLSIIGFKISELILVISPTKP